MKGASSDPPEVADKLWSGWKGKKAWDVGGHLGESIPQLLDLFDYVESFEPATESFAVMALNWIDNPWVRLHRIAVSDHDGTLDVSVREICSESGQLVAAGMPYDDFVKGVSSPQTDSLPWGKEIGTRTVLCRSVDSLARSLGLPDMIKVDTEGSELRILHGAKEVLRFGVTDFLIEFHTQENYSECVAILEDNGYKPETIRHPHYRPNTKLWLSHGWLRAYGPAKE